MNVANATAFCKVAERTTLPETITVTDCSPRPAGEVHVITPSDKMTAPTHCEEPTNTLTDCETDDEKYRPNTESMTPPDGLIMSGTMASTLGGACISISENTSDEKLFEQQKSLLSKATTLSLNMPTAPGAVWKANAPVSMSTLGFETRTTPDEDCRVTVTETMLCVNDSKGLFPTDEETTKLGTLYTGRESKHELLEGSSPRVR
jgi:hypothetical protein